jgi:hypothetical protein
MMLAIISGTSISSSRLHTSAKARSLSGRSRCAYTQCGGKLKL